MKTALYLLLGFSLLAASAVAADDPIQIAIELAGTALPYKYGYGDPAKGGLDCSGFVQVVFRRAYGVELPDEAGKQYLYLREHGKVWDATTNWTPADLKPGDLIFWSGTHPTKRPSPITHVMVYIGDNKMVGSQNAGRRLNAPGNGVGMYLFYPHKPHGDPAIDSPEFRSKMTLYGYGRVLPPARSTLPTPSSTPTPVSVPAASASQAMQAPETEQLPPPIAVSALP
jgi:hypothetical protein